MAGARGRGRGAWVSDTLLVVCRLSLVVGLVLCALSRPVMARVVMPRHFAQLTEQLAQAIDTCKRLHQELVGYDVVFRRDPMRPLIDAHGELVSSSGMSGGFSVQGIIWSDEHPLAVIDDELFAEGDVVGPYTLLTIQSGGVVVQHGAETLFIPLDRGIETSKESPADVSAPEQPAVSPPQDDAPAQDIPSPDPQSSQLEGVPAATESPSQ